MKCTRSHSLQLQANPNGQLKLQRFRSPYAEQHVTNRVGSKRKSSLLRRGVLDILDPLTYVREALEYYSTQFYNY
eukprot:1183267-Prorocentrum_minimum.AAC.5